VAKDSNRLLPLTDGGLNAVPVISRLGAELSKAGRIAYVEAEYFGGTGTQANCLFEFGQPLAEPGVSEEAINEALRFLGVTAADGKDEFDTVDLGRNRGTEGWARDT
jgi:hypothetical protein